MLARKSQGQRDLRRSRRRWRIVHGGAAIFRFLICVVFWRPRIGHWAMCNIAFSQGSHS